jgi:hypothetical protein
MSPSDETIADRLAVVHAQIAAACAACGRAPDSVELLPVSKRHPRAALLAAKAAGLATFGENRVQELAQKAAELADLGISWHLIGSLQTNKVNQLLRVPGLVVVQSLDRRDLADALQLAAHRQGRTLAVLLQIAATGEVHKHGVPPAAAAALLAHLRSACPNLSPMGVMAMGPLEGDPTPVFTRVKGLAERLRDASGLPLATLSLGMTGDMAAAIAAGSTMVRVGTGIFGARPQA